MLKPNPSNQFKRDLKRMKKRGAVIKELEDVLDLLCRNVVMDPKYDNHKLKGNYAGHWECKIRPDWLLIYMKDDTQLYLTRTGTHSDVF